MKAKAKMKSKMKPKVNNGEIKFHCSTSDFDFD